MITGKYYNFNRYDNLLYMVEDMKNSGHKIVKCDNYFELEFESHPESTAKFCWMIRLDLVKNNNSLNKLNITIDQIVDYVNLTEEEFIIKNIIE